ncbi:hypothetical protein ACFCXT_25335 [Streptomyces vinaceus]|uniref:hypothetical protein n=1 Tax=Streptomyces vinaceus TaxID=1960 RepID=UPI0035DB7B7C
MDTAAQDELTAQCAFLDARLTDLLETRGGLTVRPAVRALADTVRALTQQADEARVRGDRAGFAAATRQLHAVAWQWADHPDYQPPRCTTGSRPR